MADNKFTVGDNPDQMFSSEEIVVKYKKDAHVSRVWAMSFDELVDLQTTINTFMAGERG